MQSWRIFWKSATNLGESLGFLEQLARFLERTETISEQEIKSHGCDKLFLVWTLGVEELQEKMVSAKRRPLFSEDEQECPKAGEIFGSTGTSSTGLTLVPFTLQAHETSQAKLFVLKLG